MKMIKLSLRTSKAFFMKYIFFSIMLMGSMAWGQESLDPLMVEPEKDFENIWVKKITEDEFQSVFVIWVKHNVKKHYHMEHTENIVVLEGKGLMLLGDKEITIKKGDHINVPKGTHHAVLKVYGKPLKVLSIQSPLFDGTDRVFVETEAEY